MNIDTNNQPYYQEQQRQQSVIQMDINSRSTSSPAPLQLIRWAQRPKFASSFWEEENTFCYQVDANNICVARRQDNDMINGTKLLNVTGMSRGKRDGILKNEKARVVVKVGPMHLKGVWIPFGRAKELAHQFKISEILHPLFLDDPSIYFRNMQYHHTSPELYNFTVQSQSKPEYFPTDARHHVYPSYQRLQQYQGYSPITPTQPEFQIPSSSDQFYQQPPLMSYPPTPTDASFSFDTSTFSNQQQQQQQQPQEFNMYHNFNI